MRLLPDTPARQSLNNILQPEPRKRDRPKYTWLKQIQDDLQINNKNTKKRKSHCSQTSLKTDNAFP